MTDEVTYGSFGNNVCPFFLRKKKKIYNAEEYRPENSKKTNR
jgi:hypothetical protein